MRKILKPKKSQKQPEIPYSEIFGSRNFFVRIIGSKFFLQLTKESNINLKKKKKKKKPRISYQKNFRVEVKNFTENILARKICLNRQKSKEKKFKNWKALRRAKNFKKKSPKLQIFKIKFWSQNFP